MNPDKETKEKILEAAFDLFNKKGYDNTSLNEIVKRSGISKGGLFHHFESKYALGRDSLIWWTKKHMEPELFKDMEDEEPEKILTSFVDFMIGLLREEQNFTRFFWSIFDEAMRREEDYAIWVGFLEDYVEMVGSVYGKMGVKDPRTKAMLFLSNLDGIALYYSLLKEADIDFDIRVLREELIRTYVKNPEIERRQPV
jgi:AcrR family transcriptional regulator